MVLGRLFGTDGARGIANLDLTCELALNIGKAGAHVLTSEVHRPKILIANDSRASADMLAAAMTAGICSMGAEVVQLGVLPTPGVAYLVRQYGADAAVMISASHNSMEFNGIKWFDASGYKLSDELERRIESIILDASEELPLAKGRMIGRLVRAKKAAEDYRSFLTAQSECLLNGLRIVVDGANGAASFIAPEALSQLGAEVISVHCTPNGSNINDGCGSTHPQFIQQTVTEEGADLGLAFDGDADRLIAVDSFGRIVDGDRIMAILAIDMQSSGKLAKNTLVATVMSNLGLIKTMERAGINVALTNVGDRYVLEHMLEHGYTLGGEQSGHVICLDHGTTGDGMLTAILLLRAMVKQKKTLSELADVVKIYPQMLVNVSVENDKKERAFSDELVKAEIDKAKSTLGTDGRVLIRASGTEPLIRIMLEGESEELISGLALGIAHAVVESCEGEIRL